MFKGILNKLFKPKAAQAENPFALFDIYLNNLSANIDDDNTAYESLRESSFLVSNEYGEQVEQYNQNAALFFNLQKIERQVECAVDSENETCTLRLKYKNKLISWREVPNLASDDFEIFMVSKLVANDIEIRFDTCSAGLSDHDYYALTPKIWRQLEEKYGLEFLQSQFLPMVEFSEPNYVFELVETRLNHYL